MDGGAGSQDEFGDEMGMGDGTGPGGGKDATDHMAETPATGPTLVEQVMLIIFANDQFGGLKLHLTRIKGSKFI